ncbi:hypothetical protein [Sinomicrobium sp.]
MWIRITDISVKRVDANNLENLENPGNHMLLDLFQRETSTAFFVTKNKRVYFRYIETATGKTVPRRKWTEPMKTFAQRELEQIPLQKSVFRLTVVGWIFLLGALVLFGYLAYDGLVAAPERTEQHEKRRAELTQLHPGDIYLGRIEVYKEKGNPLGMQGEFGCFKVVSIDGDTYHLAKSIEMSKTARPIEQMNSSDFEEQTIEVKAKELSAYYKTFASEDGLTQISFREKKE